MLALLHTIGWLACVVYATIPSFWLIIHPRAEYWRSRGRSPYRLLIPIWIGMWIALSAITAFWRKVSLYRTLALDSRGFPFCCGLVDLQAFRNRLQRSPTGRSSRGCLRPSRTTTGDLGHSRTGSTPRLSGASLRHDGLEHGHGAGSLLRTHRIRRVLGRDHDPTGRQGTAASIRG